MSLRHEIAWWLRSSSLTRQLIYQPMRWARRRASGDPSAHRAHNLWERRHNDVLGCPDNAHIPRAPGAGDVRDGVQLMHNGVRVRVGSYYGDEVTRMLTRNRGVHEPQEERVFAHVLRHLGARPTMMELGAYWGFYSLWFLKERPQGRAILVEPESENLARGRDNFALNGARGEFLQAFVGSAPSTGFLGRRTVCVDELVRTLNVDHLDILHADIQGSEIEMLDGAKQTLKDDRIDYVFISTHTPALHEACRERLRSQGFLILADANLDDTYSLDGLLAARHPRVAELPVLEIALKRRDGLVDSRASGAGID